MALIVVSVSAILGYGVACVFDALVRLCSRHFDSSRGYVPRAERRPTCEEKHEHPPSARGLPLNAAGRRGARAVGGGVLNRSFRPAPSASSSHVVPLEDRLWDDPASP